LGLLHLDSINIEIERIRKWGKENNLDFIETSEIVTLQSLDVLHVIKQKYLNDFLEKLSNLHCDSILISGTCADFEFLKIELGKVVGEFNLVFDNSKSRLYGTLL